MSYSDGSLRPQSPNRGRHPTSRDSLALPHPALHESAGPIRASSKSVLCSRRRDAASAAWLPARSTRACSRPPPPRQVEAHAPCPPLRARRWPLPLLPSRVALRRYCAVLSAPFRDHPPPTLSASPFVSPLIGNIARTRVPGFAGSISSVPPNCRTRSRIPVIPTPSPRTPFRRFCKRNGSIPLPASLISSTIFCSSLHIRIFAVWLSACLWMFASASWMMRNSAVFNSRVNLLPGSLISLLTLMPLRSLNPVTYHSSAGSSPASSSNGGCNRWEMVRMSAPQ